MTEVTQRIAAKAIIFREGKVLLLRESGSYIEGTKGGKWQLPGGRINPGEPYLEGLAREILEETSLTAQVVQPIHAGEWFPVIKGVPHQIIGMFFACEPEQGDVKLSEEHDAYDWVDKDNLEKFVIIEPDKTAVIKALADSK